MLKIYTLANCDTCRAAIKWLRAAGIPFEERAIRETPPSVTELRTVLTAQGSDLRKLFNTAGREFREQKIGDKLPGMTETDALALLASHGSLVKRPFMVGDGVGLTGFNADAWAKAVAPR